MSSFLMYRSIIDRTRYFKEGLDLFFIDPKPNRTPIESSEQLEEFLRSRIQNATKGGKVALALSGGIDSAILAKMMPKGSSAYTFKCIVPGVEVIDESQQAARYAEECGLEHHIIEVFWDDMVKMSPVLMKHKGAPIHSIEVQIFKAAQRVMSDGFSGLIFGESADCLYGGLSGLLSKEWTIGEFIDRYSFVKPYQVLRDPLLITEPFQRYENDGFIDVHGFLSNVFFEESTNSYLNAGATAGLNMILPYAETYLARPLDKERIRMGENKYLIREIFNRLYPGWAIPVKTPMPRPMNEWMKDWQGPTRSEFWPNCTSTMTGDQKWYVYSLESFLNLID